MKFCRGVIVDEKNGSKEYFSQNALYFCILLHICSIMVKLLHIMKFLYLSLELHGVLRRVKKG